MPRVDRIERRIKEFEGFEIRFLHPDGQDVRGDLNLHGVRAYDYQRRAPYNMTVSEWIKTRFLPRYPGYTASVMLGNGAAAHGRTTLQTVRNSYP